MAAAGEPRRYVFGPLEQRGVLLGLQPSQLAVIGAACLLALAVMQLVPAGPGVALAFLVVASGAAAGCCRIEGRPAVSWLPVATTWLWRRAGQPAVAPEPRRGHRVVVDRRLAPVVVQPSPGVGRAGRRALPSDLGVAVLAASGADLPAVIHDRRAGTYVAVLAARGGSFPLLDPIDKQQRLAAWGGALAAVGREGTPVHRLQWIERTLPDASAAAAPAHEVLLVLAVRARRGRESPRHLLARELRVLEPQLAAAELAVDAVLGEAELVARLSDVDGEGGPPSRGMRLAASDERWAMYRTDGWWHVTYWVAEWPRLEVGPDFLSPLLLAHGVRRTVAVTMGPVGPARSARQVEAGRTADLADEQLRRRAGFLTTARRQREAEGVVRRSAELAEGHVEYRFAGYLTVSAPDRGALDEACAEVEQAASQAHLALRRLYGRQEEAFGWTLPLARGLA